MGEVGDSIGISCGNNQQNIHYKYTGDANNMFVAKGGVAEEILGVRYTRI